MNVFFFNFFFSTEKIICLNRGVQANKLFQRPIKQTSTSRRNLNNFISYSNTNENIICNGTEYHVDDLCRIIPPGDDQVPERKPCNINILNGTETIDL